LYKTILKKQKIINNNRKVEEERNKVPDNIKHNNSTFFKSNIKKEISNNIYEDKSLLSTKYLIESIGNFMKTIEDESPGLDNNISLEMIQNTDKFEYENNINKDISEFKILNKKSRLNRIKGNLEKLKIQKYNYFELKENKLKYKFKLTKNKNFQTISYKNSKEEINFPKMENFHFPKVKKEPEPVKLQKNKENLKNFLVKNAILNNVVKRNDENQEILIHKTTSSISKPQFNTLNINLHLLNNYKCITPTEAKEIFQHFKKDSVSLNKANNLGEYISKNDKLKKSILMKPISNKDVLIFDDFKYRVKTPKIQTIERFENLRSLTNSNSIERKTINDEPKPKIITPNIMSQYNFTLNLNKKNLSQSTKTSKLISKENYKGTQKSSKETSQLMIKPPLNYIKDPKKSTIKGTENQLKQLSKYTVHNKKLDLKNMYSMAQIIKEKFPKNDGNFTSRANTEQFFSSKT